MTEVELERVELCRIILQKDEEITGLRAENATLREALWRCDRIAQRWDVSVLSAFVPPSCSPTIAIRDVVAAALAARDTADSAPKKEPSG